MDIKRHNMCCWLIDTEEAKLFHMLTLIIVVLSCELILLLLTRDTILSERQPITALYFQAVAVIRRSEYFLQAEKNTV